MKHLSAVMLSALIFFGGVSGAYIDGYCAGNDRFLDVIWNYDESVTANLLQYAVLVTSWLGAAAEPSLLGEATFGAVATANFLHYMNSDKPEDQQMTEEDIPAYFEKNVTRKHGGGGLSFSDEVVDALHYTASTYLDSKSGYVLLPTATPDMVSPSVFNLKTDYDRFVQNINAIGLVICDVDIRKPVTNPSAYFPLPNGEKIKVCGYFCHDVLSMLKGSYSTNNAFYIIREDWSTDLKWRKYGTLDLSFKSGKIYSSLDDFMSDSDLSYYSGSYSLSQNCDEDYWYIGYSPDGRYVKVWYDFQAYKDSDIGKPAYYATKQWVNYDYSVDNSITISDSYINSNVHNGNVINNYNNIQNTVNNANPDGSLTEDEIYDIVQDAMEDYFDKNNTDNGGSGGSGDNTGGGSGDSGNTGGDSGDTGGGSGVGSVIDGVGSLLDTVLNIIGKLLSLLSGFVESVLALFEGFTIFTDGFSGFLTATFGFIPAEAINVIVSGITLMVILAVIKFLK